MPSGKNFYEDIIQYTQEQFDDIFKDSVVFQMKQVHIEHMGYFKLKYKYLPNNYELVFENDRNVFEIEIYDEEEAKQLLYRVEKYDGGLSKENIKDALIRLKKVLEEAHIVFYVRRDKKLYKKINGQYLRVKDLKELE